MKSDIDMGQENLEFDNNTLSHPNKKDESLNEKVIDYLIINLI